MACPTYSHGHRCLASRHVAPAAHVCIDQCCLIALVDFRAFGPGSLFNGRVLLLKPLLHRLWPLFTRLLDRLLRGKSPTCQVLANASNLQPDAKLLLNELAHYRTTPQTEIHFELLGALVDDQSLDGLLLRRTQDATITAMSPSQSRANRLPVSSTKRSMTPRTIG